MRTLTLLLGVLGAVLALGSAPPRTALRFDGLSSYAEIPDSDVFSVSLTGLSVSVWLRPDARRFPKTEGSLPTEQFVHWLGKGETGRQEWTFRMYSRSTHPGPRDNRISFYVFNLAGGRGCGSYFQDPVEVGKWLHVVGVVDTESHTTAIYKNGQLRNTNAYGGTITPAHGIAPLRLGTKNFASFLRGALSQVRVWNRPLTAAEITALYATNVVPQDGLVAAYLLNEGRGTVAHDSQGHPQGTVVGGTWDATHHAISATTGQSGGGC